MRRACGRLLAVGHAPASSGRRTPAATGLWSHCRRLLTTGLVAALGYGLGSGTAQAQPPGMIPGDAPPMYQGMPGQNAPLMQPEVGGPIYYDGSPMPDEGVPWWDGAQDYADGEGVTPLIYAWYARAEYLNWSISDPGHTLLGAPIVGNPDPTKPFTVVDQGNNVIGVATVPTTENMHLRDNSGGRIVLGTEFNYGGTLEVGGFVTEKTRSFTTPVGLGELVQYDRVPIPLTNPVQFQPVFAPRVIGNSTFVNGQLANNIELYNQSYTATYFSQLWGADANYYFDTDRDGLFQFQPSVGFKYVGLREKLLQRGTFRDSTFNPAIDTNSEIDSLTRNNMFGPTVGFKSELVGKYLSFGFDNKLGFLANDHTGEVRTIRFRSNVDPEVRTVDRDTMLSTVYDMTVYTKWNITPRFSLRLGYNFMYLGRVTRPEDNIFYNDNGAFVPPFALTPPDVRVNMTRHDIRVHGFNLGGEYRW
jgi:hypothetical protein